MSTSKETLKDWFEKAKQADFAYMIVACDTFDWEDYPIYVSNSDIEFYEKYDSHNNTNMQRIMEIYDISLGWEAQSDGRVRNMPDRPNSKPQSLFPYTMTVTIHANDNKDVVQSLRSLINDMESEKLMPYTAITNNYSASTTRNA